MFGIAQSVTQKEPQIYNQLVRINLVFFVIQL